MSENEGGARLEPIGYRIRTQYGRAAVYPRKDESEVPGPDWAASLAGIELTPCYGDTPAEAIRVLVAKLRIVADGLEKAAAVSDV